MDRINYNHLRCFWATAKGGSITRACETLDLTQPTISKQIGELEESLGEALFRRSGRRLVLTDVGRTVQAYADDIFTLGQELTDALRGVATGKPLRLHVGVSDVVPKLLTRLVLEPALRQEQRVTLVCREGKTEPLLADLALSGLDLVITDAPPPMSSRIKVHHTVLLESPVALYGAPELAKRYAGSFPYGLHNAPVLLPTENTQLRASIDAWIEERALHLHTVGEFEDSALIKSFGEAGHGLFASPTAVEEQIHKHYAVERVGNLDGVTETVYAITAERRVRHPGVAAIIEHAQASAD